MFCLILQASLRYRNDIPNINALRASEVAQAECFVRDAQFLEVDIESANISIDSLELERIIGTLYNVTAVYSFVYEEPQHSVLDGFDVWLMSRQAPENTTSNMPLPHLSRIQRNGFITRAIDIERNVTELVLYLQVSSKDITQVLESQ